MLDTVGSVVRPGGRPRWWPRGRAHILLLFCPPYSPSPPGLVLAVRIWGLAFSGTFLGDLARSGRAQDRHTAAAVMHTEAYGPIGAVPT